MSFFPVSVPTTLELLDARNNIGVTLDGAINDVITTIPLLDTADIPDSGFLTATDGSNEVIQYTGKTASSITGCTRGADGTTPANHADTTVLGMWNNARYHNILADEINGICQNLSDRIGLHATRIVLQDYLDANSKKISSLAAGTVAGDAVRYEQVILANGSNAFTADQPMGTFKLTGLGAGSTAGDSVRYEQVLLLAGGTMAGNIAMGGSYKLTNLVAGSGAGDSVRYEQVLLLAGGTMTGQIITPAGTAAAPAIGVGGADLGLYLVGANVLGFSVAGVYRWHMNSIGDLVIAASSTGQILASGGSAATPSYSFNVSGQTDTGIYNPSSDAIGFSTGGVLRVTVDNSGLTVNSGALTATVNFADGSVSAPSIRFTNNTDTGLYLGSSGGPYIGLTVDSTLQFYAQNGLVMNTGVIGNMAGSAASPSYTFWTDSDTGMYSYGANAIGFSCLGAYRFVISDSSVVSTVQVIAPAGSAAAPSYTFQGDADTGMYRDGADAIGFSIGGTGSYVINNTAFYSKKLLALDGSMSLPAYSFQSNTDCGMYLSGSDVNIVTNGSLAMSIQTGFTQSYRDFNSSTAGGKNLGDSLNYWNDISYKTLTDRGCLPWCDDGVELIDGSKVSDLEALCQIKKHKTKKTVHGLPMLDYKSFPKKAYRPADRYGDLIRRDENDEPEAGADGIEMTMMFGVFIGAFKEITKRLEALEEAA